MEPKEIPSRLIPRLLVIFTRQLEILVTTLEVKVILMNMYLSITCLSASGMNSIIGVKSR